MFKTITSIEGAQQQHRAMTASPRPSLLSTKGDGWVLDMPAWLVLRLIPVAAAASASELPQLRSSPCRSHVNHPTSPGGTASTSLLLRDLVPNQTLLALPAAHGAASPQPPTPPGQAVAKDLGAQTTPAAGETPLPAQLRHMFWGRHTRRAPGEEAVAARLRAGAGSQQQASSGTCPPEAQVCSPSRLLCKSPRAGDRKSVV